MRPDRSKISGPVAAVLKWDVAATSRALERKYPDTWRRINTRTIESPPDYFGSKVVSVGIVSAIEEARAGHLDSNVGIIAGVLEKFDFPTYYVSRPLVEALSRSSPPKSLTWEDLTLPFKALTFMVPRGCLVEPEPTKGEMACVGVAKLLAGERLEIPSLPGRAVEGLTYDRICIYWILGPSGLEMNDSTFPVSHPLEPLGDWIDAKSEGRPYGGPPGAFASTIAGLVANFILIMEARKELVEPGSLLRRPPGVGRPGVYSPTFIGRNYSILKKDRDEDVERQSKFTELGWRAGHFKRQRFGLRSEQTKTIFVDPYIAFSKGLQKL